MTPYYAGAVAGGVDPGSSDHPDESGLQFRRFDMHQHVRDARVALLDGAFDAMRDFVAFVHRHVAIHSDMKIDIKIQSHLSGATFLNLNDSWH